MDFADKNNSKQFFCISIYMLRQHQPYLLPPALVQVTVEGHILQENLFDVLLALEEETVSKHPESMQRSVKAQAIICAPFIHIKLKSQTLCPIDGNMHWSESRLDLRVISWFLSTFGTSACLTAHQGLMFFFPFFPLQWRIKEESLCAVLAGEWYFYSFVLYKRDETERRNYKIDH